MQPFRTAELAARVVAWHNRHPLARRIAPAQVMAIGVVSLPFALREPAPDGAAAATPALTSIFDAQWMYGADEAALAHFVLAHGAYPLDAAAHWPWRQVDADLARAHAADAQGLEGRTARHLLSAVIEVDGRRSRVLVAPAAPLKQATVFGRRLFDPRRVVGGIGSGAVAAGLLAGGLALLLAPQTGGDQALVAQTTATAASGVVAAAGHERPQDSPHGAPPDNGPGDNHGHAPDAPTAVAHAASTPDLAASASHGDVVPHPAASQHADAEPQATADTASTAAVPTSVHPTDVSPMLQDAAAAGPLVRIRPALTEDERRQARLQAEALRPSPVASAAAANLLKGTVFALATPPLRSRDDAQAQQVLLHSMKAQVATPVPTQLDVMAAGKRWRVVWWPHPKAEDAERLRLEASARGLKLEVIAF
ncbi:MAG: hypothetical protein H6933_12700 [Burkholderiaceae bacterium]|nr:hypothetical protein [Burkholderiaceae bacterium]